jgi:DNA-binding transcriptional regulator YbjK
MRPKTPPQKQIPMRLKQQYHLASLQFSLRLPLLDEQSELIKRYALAHHLRALRDLSKNALPSDLKRLEQIAVQALYDNGQNPPIEAIQSNLIKE